MSVVDVDVGEIKRRKNTFSLSTCRLLCVASPTLPLLLYLMQLSSATCLRRASSSDPIVTRTTSPSQVPTSSASPSTLFATSATQASTASLSSSQAATAISPSQTITASRTPLPSFFRPPALITGVLVLNITSLGSSCARITPEALLIVREYIASSTGTALNNTRVCFCTDDVGTVAFTDSGCGGGRLLKQQRQRLLQAATEAPLPVLTMLGYELRFPLPSPLSNEAQTPEQQQLASFNAALAALASAPTAPSSLPLPVAQSLETLLGLPNGSVTSGTFDAQSILTPALPAGASASPDPAADIVCTGGISGVVCVSSTTEAAARAAASASGGVVSACRDGIVICDGGVSTPFQPTASGTLCFSGALISAESDVCAVPGVQPSATGTGSNAGTATATATPLASATAFPVCASGSQYELILPQGGNVGGTCDSAYTGITCIIGASLQASWISGAPASPCVNTYTTCASGGTWAPIQPVAAPGMACYNGAYISSGSPVCAPCLRPAGIARDICSGRGDGKHCGTPAAAGSGVECSASFVQCGGGVTLSSSETATGTLCRAGVAVTVEDPACVPPLAAPVSSACIYGICLLVRLLCWITCFVGRTASLSVHSQFALRLGGSSKVTLLARAADRAFLQVRGSGTLALLPPSLIELPPPGACSNNALTLIIIPFRPLSSLPCRCWHHHCALLPASP